MREEVTQQFEFHCSVSFVPRYGEATLDGNGGADLWLPYARTSTLHSVTIDGTSVPTSSFVLYPSGRLHYKSGTFSAGEQNVVVTFEHGWLTPPGEVVRAALVYVQSLLIGTDIMDRSVSHTDETGTYRLSYPDMKRERPTGIPYVDAILHKYTEPWGVQ